MLKTMLGSWDIICMTIYQHLNYWYTQVIFLLTLQKIIELMIVA